MKAKTYAQLRSELDELIVSFSGEELDVDQAIVAYEKAIKLQAELKDYLTKAENKVKKLSQTSVTSQFVAQYATISDMKKLDQQGAVNAWLIGFVVTVILLLGALGFGFAMFSSRQDYKNNVDQKITEAVQVAEQKLTEKKEAEFTEREKQPLKTYTGPEAYGSLSVAYPKTWAAYIDESGKGSNPMDGYLNPSFVPGVQSNPTVALRFQVVNTPYATTAKNLEPLVKSGKIKTTPFVASKVANVTGLRADGEIVTKKSGSMILLPLRDKTLKIWTESPQFIADFNDIILANVTFVP